MCSLERHHCLPRCCRVYEHKHCGRAVSHTIRDNFSPGKPHKELDASAGAEAISTVDEIRTADGPKSTNEVRSAMQKVMQTDASVFRTEESLQEGVKK